MAMATGVAPAFRTLYTIGRDPTACADLSSAVDQDADIEAFEEWNAEDLPEVEFSPPKESDFPRYQIQVHLVNRDSVP